MSDAIVSWPVTAPHEGWQHPRCVVVPGFCRTKRGMSCWTGRLACFAAHQLMSPHWHRTSDGGCSLDKGPVAEERFLVATFAHPTSIRIVCWFPSRAVEFVQGHCIIARMAQLQARPYLYCKDPASTTRSPTSRRDTTGAFTNRDKVILQDIEEAKCTFSQCWWRTTSLELCGPSRW